MGDQVGTVELLRLMKALYAALCEAGDGFGYHDDTADGAFKAGAACMLRLLCIGLGVAGRPWEAEDAKDELA